ncbi:MAG: hypothetical protein KF729_18490 [Sandaracinaceae bacterium]|nr:hypothetical protein [Sandaracinaceae bacterium]
MRVALLGLLLFGCSDCDGPAVPFGLDASARPLPEARPAAETPAAGGGVARRYEEGTTSVDLDGARLALDGAIRATYARDVDGDGHADVFAIADGPPRVVYLRRRGERFEAPVELARPSAPEGCRVGDAALEALGPTWAHARLALACAGDATAEAVHHVVLDAERATRRLEHLSVSAGDERSPGALTLALDRDDRDEDGHDDLVVRATLEHEGARVEIALVWLDRPSGLARQPGEPEATLGERSLDALRRLERRPREALARSREVLALHRALCREPGVARLAVGGVAGLPCAQSEGAGRAATTVVRAHAALGETQAALDALDALSEPGLRINDERRRFARRALGSLPASGDATLREGPPVRVAPASGAALSALGFLDEDRILVRSAPPSVWDLASGELRAAQGERAERTLRDPSGRFELAAIERTCDGHVLRIVASGLPASSPLVAPRAPPAGAACPLAGRAAEDAGGWVALGWPPQGVLTMREGELRLVPLDLSARAAGPPQVLEPGAPLPLPLPPGAVSADGRHVVALRGLAVRVMQLAPRAPPVLLWPERWGALDADPTDAAVSPSGRRVAVIRGGRLLSIERPEAAPR